MTRNFKKKPDAIISMKSRQNFSFFINTLIGVFVPFSGRFEGCE